MSLAAPLLDRLAQLFPAFVRASRRSAPEPWCPPPWDPPAFKRTSQERTQRLPQLGGAFRGDYLHGFQHLLLSKNALTLSYTFTWESMPVDAVVSLTPGKDGIMHAQIDFAGGAYTLVGIATKKPAGK